MTVTFKHPILGEVKGKTSDVAVQFLGLKYASLENRFSAPQLQTAYAPGGIDASKYGLVRTEV